MRTPKTNYTSLVLLAATTLVVAACSSNSDYGMEMPPPVNAAPVVSAITDRTSDQDAVVGPIEFSIDDDGTPANQLTVTAAADGTSLFPADGIALGGGGAVRSITLTPLEAATGVAAITLTVIDSEGLRSTRSFQVTVNARSASIRDTTLATFARAQSDEATAVNGFTFTQDADDPATFQALIGDGEE